MRLEGAALRSIRITTSFDPAHQQMKGLATNEQVKVMPTLRGANQSMCVPLLKSYQLHAAILSTTLLTGPIVKKLVSRSFQAYCQHRVSVKFCQNDFSILSSLACLGIGALQVSLVLEALGRNNV